MLFVYNNLEALSRAAANHFTEQAHAAIQNNGTFCVALSGGETPLATYRLLAESPYREDLEWEKLHIFWGDERCVPANDPRSNALQARLAFLDKVPIPTEHIHSIPGDLNPMIAAQEYEQVLKDFFHGYPPRLDLIFLGLGGDGHTASLFPRSPALKDPARWVVDTYNAENDLHRVTMTPNIINRAAVITFLVSGIGKAWVLREVLQGQADSWTLPAKSIKPLDGTLNWFVDRDASSSLSEQV